jgi:2-dehydropantoate 2-reductase
MRYLVFGSGAVGSWVGGMLARSGQPVAFLGRPPTVAHLQSKGLAIRVGGEAFSVETPWAYEQADQAIQDFQPQVVLLTVKAYDLAPAAAVLRQYPDPVVVSLLNGIGPDAALAQTLGSGRVISATLTSAVRVLAPGEIEVSKRRGMGLAGDHPLLPDLHEQASQAGLRPAHFDDPGRMKWSKLLTNIVANACSAILDWTPRSVYSHPGIYRLELESLRELVAVMHAQGWQPQNLPGVPAAWLAPLLRLPPPMIQPLLARVIARGRGGKPPSLRSDLGRRRSEAPWLNGAVVQAGRQFSVPTPANQVLFEVMMALVANAAAAAGYRDQPQVLLQLAQQAGVPGVQGYNPTAPA